MSGRCIDKEETVLNAGMSDRIKAAKELRGVIRVFKSKSTYNLFQDANGVWSKQEVTNYIGMVAPHSLSTGVGGVFYLTDNGVFKEGEGIYKNRYFDVGPVSIGITELDTLSITKKSDAVGFQYKDLYILSLSSSGFAFPTGKTFVRFNKTGEWATWDLEFGGTTLYSTETVLDFVPGDTLYFFEPGGSDILRFGTSELDGAGTIRVHAKSAPFLTQSLGVYKTINRVGIAVKNSGNDDTLFFSILDETGE